MYLLKRPKIYHVLLPFSWLYRLGVELRNLFFDLGWLKSKQFDLPVICVGNITVGGTGKTPHTEYLIRLLSDTFQVAVLSRGYKRKSKGLVWAQPDTPIEELGDEPFQMWKKFPDIQMVVDRNRCEGIEFIRQQQTSEVVILDDAFQHRYVQPGLSILLIDYNRPIFGDEILPAGRLREPVRGKKRADMILVSKCPETLKEEERQAWMKAISPAPDQQVFFTTFKYQKLQNVFQPQQVRELESIGSDEHILLLTGIASPASLIQKLSAYTPHITPMTFADHHLFTDEELTKVAERFGQLPDKRILITTDKDAVRLRTHPALPEALKSYLYTLPIEVDFLYQQASLFNQNIIEYVRKNSRNSSLSEG